MFSRPGIVRSVFVGSAMGFWSCWHRRFVAGPDERERSIATAAVRAVVQLAAVSLPTPQFRKQPTRTCLGLARRPGDLVWHVTAPREGQDRQSASARRAAGWTSPRRAPRTPIPNYEFECLVASSDNDFCYGTGFPEPVAPGTPNLSAGLRAALCCEHQPSIVVALLFRAACEGWPGSGLPQHHDPPACPCRSPAGAIKTGGAVACQVPGAWTSRLPGVDGASSQPDSACAGDTQLAGRLHHQQGQDPWRTP